MPDRAALPPETTSTIGPAAGTATVPDRRAASPTTEDGSTSSLVASMNDHHASRIAVSSTVTTRSTFAWTCATVFGPANGAARPSAIDDGLIGGACATPVASTWVIAFAVAGFHSDNFSGTDGLRRAYCRRHTRDQPTAADRHQDEGGLRAVDDQLDADRALAGDYVRVVERVQRQVVPFGRGTVAGADEIVGKHDLAAVPVHGLHLRLDRARRHTDGGRDAENPGSVRRRGGRVPAENVVTPAGGSSLAARASIAFIMPRTLKLPVCCRFSALRSTGTPNSSERQRTRQQWRPDDLSGEPVGGDGQRGAVHQTYGIEKVHGREL